MSESPNKPVDDRRAVADARGIRGNLPGAEHDEGQAGTIESGVWPPGTSAGITVSPCSSDLGFEASAIGSALREVQEKIEALKQTALRCVEPLLTNGAGI
jgi:hypothetical protein